MRHLCIAVVMFAATSVDAATPAETWRDLAAGAPPLVKKVRTTLLDGKNLKQAPLVYSGHRYRAKLDGQTSYGQKLCRFYFSRVLKAKTVAETFQIVRDLSAASAEFHAKNAPLLAEAEVLEALAQVLHESIVAKPDIVKSLKDATFPGAGTDELSLSMKGLAEALAAGDAAAATAWSGEVLGATRRLVDLLRWVDLQTEWICDLARVLDAFRFCIETSDREVAAAGGWKNFMFGRLPGASSLMELSVSDALMTELMLCDFFIVTDAESAAMGKKGTVPFFAVLPGHRAGFVKIHDALPKHAQTVFASIPTTDYELSAFNANLWRYGREKQIDNLIESLKHFAKREKKPSVTTMMEVIHIAQGAFGSTTSAGDRYHAEMIAWSKKLKGKPEKAVAQAHALAYGFYTQGGRARYRGRLWTIHDAQKAGATDCIRASQMMGSAYANAGYTGLHPVRICRGNVRQKIAGVSGHTFVCAELGKKNVCLDPLMKRSFLRPFEKMHAGDSRVLSVAKGYRTLDSFTSGAIRFPQGPLKPVQLRMPYYMLERKGFKEEKS